MQPDIAKTRQAAAAGLLALARKEITTGEAKELARKLNAQTKEIHKTIKNSHEHVSK